MEYIKLRNRTVMYNNPSERKRLKQKMKQIDSYFVPNSQKRINEGCSNDRNDVIFVSNSRDPVETIDLTGEDGF